LFTIDTMQVENKNFFFFVFILQSFRALSTCLKSVHCPLDVKSFGGLILNLLRLLGINNCNTDDQNQSCPNEKRFIILKELFTYWTKTNDDTYCKLGFSFEHDSWKKYFVFSTISTFMSKVKSEIEEQCPLNSRQVEAFLENYLCLSNRFFFIVKKIEFVNFRSKKYDEKYSE